MLHMSTIAESLPSEFPDYEDDAHVDEESFQLRIAVHAPVMANPQTAILAHPVLWMMAGALVYLTAFFFPPKLFENLFAMESSMFLDLRSAAFTGSCIAILLAGVWCGLGGTLNAGAPRMLVGTELDETPLTANGLLLMFTMANLASCAIFVRAGGIGVIRAALQGSETLDRGMREMIDQAGGQLWMTAIVLSSIFAPAGYQMARSVRRHPWTRTLYVLFIITYVIAALLASRRNYIARPLFGVLLAWLVWPPVRGFTRRSALMTMGGAAVLMLAVFTGFGILRRGLSETSEALSEVIRYLLTPYNTQSLIMNDPEQIPGHGTGYYWTEWLWQFPVISDIFDLDALRDYFLGDKAPTGFRERAPILTGLGIDTGTAMPAFLLSWIDLGWFGLLPFFVVGVICARCWKGFLRGSSISIILYPTIAYSFAEWRANLLFPSVMTSYALIIVAMILVGRVLERRAPV